MDKYQIEYINIIEDNNHSIISDIIYKKTQQANSKKMQKLLTRLIQKLSTQKPTPSKPPPQKPKSSASYRKISLYALTFFLVSNLAISSYSKKQI